MVRAKESNPRKGTKAAAVVEEFDKRPEKPRHLAARLNIPYQAVYAAVRRWRPRELRMLQD